MRNHLYIKYVLNPFQSVKWIKDMTCFQWLSSTTLTQICSGSLVIDLLGFINLKLKVTVQNAESILFYSTLFFSILFYCCNVVFLRYWCGLTIAYFGSLHPLTCRRIISPERFFNSVIHHHAWEFHRALMHWLCTLTEPQLKEMNQGFPECSVKPLELAGRLSWLQRTSVCISASSAFMGMHVFSGVIWSVI